MNERRTPGTSEESYSPPTSEDDPDLWIDERPTIPSPQPVIHPTSGPKRISMAGHPDSVWDHGHEYDRPYLEHVMNLVVTCEDPQIPFPHSPGLCPDGERIEIWPIVSGRFDGRAPDRFVRCFPSMGMVG